VLVPMQGFCCSCTSGQVFQETVGKPKERTRAGLNCNFWDNPYLPVFGSPPGSASCMVYQSEWCACVTFVNSHGLFVGNTQRARFIATVCKSNHAYMHIYAVCQLSTSGPTMIIRQVANTSTAT
jgi:hypothetical protein